MDLPLYLIARGMLALIRVLPLTTVAQLGRVAGWIAYWLDERHRRVALTNLELAFGSEKTPGELQAIAIENFRRIGENFACAAKTAQMDDAELRPHIEFTGWDWLSDEAVVSTGQSCIFAVGHFGNFELYARVRIKVPAYERATTYRGLNQPRLDRLLLQLRERSGCRFLERRTEGELMRQILRRKRTILGLLVDQHAGRSGLPVPFFGHVCSTSRAPALLALRHNSKLFICVCYRIALARWRIELGPEIPIREQGQARPLDAIMTDVNRAFETAVRRDPANWFWVHRRWKGKVQKPLHSRNDNQTKPPTAHSSHHNESVPDDS